MKRLLTLFVVALMSFGVALGDAEAKRLGGGRSIGKQRESISREATPQPPARSPAAAPGAAPAPAQAAPPKSGMSKWLGPLAGLAAGVALGSMFSHLGMGGGFMGLLLVLLLVFAVIAVVRAMRRAPQPQTQRVEYAGLGSHDVSMPAPAHEPAPAPMSAAPAAAPAASTRPAWFEDETFLRAAKAHFIRLQAANDAKDLNDIREYTTPEMFAEISLQIQERGNQPQRTDVVVLNAEILDVVTEGEKVTASVRFWGMLREEADQAAQPFDEIWHVQKSSNQPGGTWFLAGIQQVH